ncbi:hypothetical protein CYMTET_39356 [Cymbomonas tetramitiformis]|uniref:Uncharacterized protein n=1 Tax=Cymbomonas tetramitiformis TaxID=36881 RepID=A0AAE0CA81_9CHLO|nr:hypothetical protein CYMTET_39356 [Cymbomonas tetramitiformis]
MIMTGWKLWPFAHCVTYGLIPQQHRLLFVDTVEIVWVVLLSLFESRDHGQPQQGLAQQDANDLSQSLPSAAVATGDQAQSAEDTRGCPRDG